MLIDDQHVDERTQVGRDDPGRRGVQAEQPRPRPRRRQQRRIRDLQLPQNRIEARENPGLDVRLGIRARRHDNLVLTRVLLHQDHGHAGRPRHGPDA